MGPWSDEAEAIIRDIVHTISRIPNVPFLWKPMFNVITSLLQRWGVKHFSVAAFKDFEKGVWAHDWRAIYIYIRRGRFLPLTIIDSHLDHPGFVSDGHGRALALGSVGFRRVFEIARKDPIKVRFFEHNSGELIGEGTLSADKEPGNIRPFFLLRSDGGLGQIPRNTHVQWALPSFEQRNGAWHLYAADNLVPTAVALALLRSLIRYPEQYPHVNALFVFPFLEEIFEISASSIAKSKETPFGKIKSKPFVVVLESMQVLSLPRKLHENQTIDSLYERRIAEDLAIYSQGDALLSGVADMTIAPHPIYERFSLPYPNYNAGLLIKINDVDVPFGQPDEENLSISRALFLARQANIPHQVTVSSGACNGTAYSLFSLSPHIVTLVIPTVYKHNIAVSGVKREKVLRRDVISMYVLLQKWLQLPNYEISKQEQQYGWIEEAKRLLMPPKSYLRQIRLERTKIVRNSYHRLRFGAYFPATLYERLLIGWDKVVARISGVT